MPRRCPRCRLSDPRRPRFCPNCGLRLRAAVADFTSVNFWIILVIAYLVFRHLHS